MAFGLPVFLWIFLVAAGLERIAEQSQGWRLPGTILSAVVLRGDY